MPELVAFLLGEEPELGKRGKGGGAHRRSSWRLFGGLEVQDGDESRRPTAVIDGDVVTRSGLPGTVLLEPTTVVDVDDGGAPPDIFARPGDDGGRENGDGRGGGRLCCMRERGERAREG